MVIVFAAGQIMWRLRCCHEVRTLQNEYACFVTSWLAILEGID